ncbi:phage tail sheath subtilisin-like domain-containing protein [Pandoraea nosoerga]|uniref:Bacteriophage Mu tail sheath family protein n=1 Tax=Pandoraea nosoerga TaxID=2508296 RepID=A0A5E4T7H3_9BURK|nr:phage tail sheath subtilisin-like domain-containing protein [Pandoraea nosoerga]MBN4664219.1 phage tail sheath subtilisin-like domain-containing protein [Pandoraea nosoerga]MBN4675372.1 phage tail sheath subtilisin-like domain-containing protein [Pandoraea nosoerga]MBN4679306.1 phage tail sheath subtilisin-like domain-containing protein [Pandoraea nosoerga]MBN4743696.1 phage tail sheath subtilisin-like domain-containing protein [Pandoraea nosoerga]VVD84040.1 bacteriophage Mu tail sheath fam
MASPNVSFDTIPSGLRKPGQYVEYNTRLAVRNLPTNEQTVLIVGQRLAGGATPALTPIDIFSGDQAASAFGAGSLAHRAAVAAIKANKYVTLTVIAVDDAAAGQPAKGTVEFAGTATADGAFALYVANDRVDVATYADDTAAMIAARLVDTITQTEALPVTATLADAKVTITAKNKGEMGNAIKLDQFNRSAGVTATITAMAGGLNDPDISPALDAVFGATYNIYVSCWNTQATLTKLRDHLKTISNAIEKRSAIGVVGTPDTLSTGTTLAGALNAERITIGWHRGSVCLPAEIAAGYAAVVASETDPARPLNTLVIEGLDVTPVTMRPSRTEQEKALHNGVTPLEIGPGDTVQIVRAITTYTKNSTGADDPALLDLTTIRTLDYFRKAVVQRVALRFPRDKLSTRTPPKVRSEILDVAIKCEELEILENVDAHKGMLIVEKDSQDANTLNAAIPADIVNGLHIFAGRIDLIL